MIKKKEGFALNEADVDQLITQTACFCCCHGIKLCLPVLIRQPRCEKLFETRERLGVDSVSVSVLQKKINFQSLSDGLTRISNHPCSIALHMACCSNLMKYAAVTLQGLKFIYT